MSDPVPDEHPPPSTAASTSTATDHVLGFAPPGGFDRKTLDPGAKFRRAGSMLRHGKVASDLDSSPLA